MTGHHHSFAPSSGPTFHRFGEIVLPMYYPWHGLGAHLALNQLLVEICSNPNRIHLQFRPQLYLLDYNLLPMHRPRYTPTIYPLTIPSSLSARPEYATPAHFASDCLTIVNSCLDSGRIFRFCSAPPDIATITTHYSALVPILNNFSRQNPYFLTLSDFLVPILKNDKICEPI